LSLILILHTGCPITHVCIFLFTQETRTYELDVYIHMYIYYCNCELEFQLCRMSYIRSPFCKVFVNRKFLLITVSCFLLMYFDDRIKWDYKNALGRPLNDNIESWEVSHFEAKYHTLNWHFVTTDFLQWVPCVMGHPVYARCDVKLGAQKLTTAL
jgi:hypothetical protein